MSIKYIYSDIPGVLLVVPKVFDDTRGFFMVTFQNLVTSPNANMRIKSSVFSYLRITSMRIRRSVRQPYLISET